MIDEGGGPGYASRRGWALFAVSLELGVIPLIPARFEFGDDGALQPACGCSAGAACMAVGKHPAVSGWQRRFASTEVQALGLVAGHPGCGLGVVTGSASGVIVIDVDPRNGGMAGLADLEARRGPLPATLTVVTGRGDGGGHRYYRIPDDVIVKSATSGLAPGVDVKGEKGFVVFPPTRHAVGGYYDVASDAPLDIAPLPGDLLRRLAEPKAPATRVVSAVFAAGAAVSADPAGYAERGLASVCDQLRRLPGGSRNTETNRGAFACGQLVGLGLLGGEDAAHRLTSAAVAAGLSGREAFSAVTSGLVSGASLVDPEQGRQVAGILSRIGLGR